MHSFLKGSSGYLIVSLILNGLIILQTRMRANLFRRKFPGRATASDLDDDETQRWAGLCEDRFESGPWRLITILFMFYHYPGIVLNAIRKGDSVPLTTKFLAAAAIWMPIIALITKPWKG